MLDIVADEDDDGNEATESAKQDPPRQNTGGGRRMPFGKTRGKLLTELTDDELNSACQWCSETDEKRAKFADLIADILTEIDRRGGHDGE